MKLNNKGFAISSIMYIILIMAFILISVTLAILSSRKLILDKIKKETADNIYGISYNSVINTLKNEAISYASNNNVEKENIKIGDFETSVSQELLEHHELSDKYLTLYKNNYSYDVYLGQTKKVTDISKPIDNMLGIASYKIEGNSFQQTYTGKNLFDKNKFETKNQYTLEKTSDEDNNEVIKFVDGDVTGIENFLSPNIEFKENAVYTISFKMRPVSGTINPRINIYYTDGTDQSFDSQVSDANYNSYSITSQSGKTINSIGSSHAWGVYGYILMDSIQIEEGSTATSYEPYVGGVASPNPQYPQEIKSVGERTKNIADLSKTVTATTTPKTKFSYDNQTGTLELTSQPSQYDYAMIYIERDLGIKLEPGKKYYCGAIVTVSGKQTTDKTYVKFGLSTTNNNYTSTHTYTSNGTFELNETVVYQEDENLRLIMNFNVGSEEPAQVKFEKIYVSEVDEFEPYRDNYNIPITARGKNLLDISDIEVNSSTKKIDCNLTEKFVVSAQEIPTSITDANGVDRNIWRMSFTYLDGSMKYMMDDAFKGVEGTTNVFSASEDNPVVSIEYRNTYIREGAYRNIQIEYGTKATSYEPYIEPVTTNIYLDEPLRKIGEYTDYIDFEKGETVREIGEVDMFALEWLKFSNWSDYYCNNTLKFKETYGNNNFAKEKPPLMCTHFDIATRYDMYHKKATNHSVSHFILNSRKTLTAYSRSHEDETAFKNSLKGVMLQYALEAPLIKTIVVPNIQTNMGSSVIEVDTSILPSSVEFTVIEKIRKL